MQFTFNCRHVSVVTHQPYALFQMMKKILVPTVVCGATYYLYEKWYLASGTTDSKSSGLNSDGDAVKTKQPNGLSSDSGCLPHNQVCILEENKKLSLNFEKYFQ